jgi:hypothetical protein
MWSYGGWMPEKVWQHYLLSSSFSQRGAHQKMRKPLAPVNSYWRQVPAHEKAGCLACGQNN